MKLSVGIVCSNSRHHLAYTLKKNLQDNFNDNIEFILLDYNSSDGLYSWLIEHFESNLNSGKLKYFKTIEQEAFNSHRSKNILFSLCEGEIICCFEPDYFIGKNFIPSVIDSFKSDKNIFITPIINRLNNLSQPSCICFSRKDIINLNGLNENSLSDFYCHIKESLIKIELIQHNIKVDTDFIKLDHNDEDKSRIERLVTLLDKVYVSKRTDLKSDFIFFFKNNEFHYGSFQSNNKIHFGMDLLKGSFKVGKWFTSNNTSYNQKERSIKLNSQEEEISIFEQSFQKVNNYGFQEYIFKHYPELIKGQSFSLKAYETSNNTNFGKGELMAHYRNKFFRISTINGKPIKYKQLNDLIFRLDDIGDLKYTNVQIHIINTFLEHNLSLVLALQTNDLIQNDKMIDFLKSISNNKYIEFSCHSSNHLNLGSLSYTDQKKELVLFFNQLALILPKIKVRSLTPPYNSYNENTIKVCKDLGIKCISSSVGIKIKENFDTNGIDFFDASVSTGGWSSILKLEDSSVVIQNIRTELNKKSIDNSPVVIMLHGQEFNSNTSGDMTNKGKVELEFLINEIKRLKLSSTRFIDCI